MLLSTLFYTELSKLSLLFIFSIALAFVIIFLSYSLSVANPDSEKVSAKQKFQIFISERWYLLHCCFLLGLILFNPYVGGGAYCDPLDGSKIVEEKEVRFTLEKLIAEIVSKEEDSYISIFNEISERKPSSMENLSTDFEQSCQVGKKRSIDDGRSINFEKMFRSKKS